MNNFETELSNVGKTVSFFDKEEETKSFVIITVRINEEEREDIIDNITL